MFEKKRLKDFWNEYMHGDLPASVFMATLVLEVFSLGLFIWLLFEFTKVILFLIIPLAIVWSIATMIHYFVTFDREDNND